MVDDHLGYDDGTRSGRFIGCSGRGSELLAVAFCGKIEAARASLGGAPHTSRLTIEKSGRE